MAKVTRKDIQDLQNYFVAAGIMKDPMSYTEEELKHLNPEIPGWFIEDYVQVRDGVKPVSDIKRVPLRIDDI